MTVAAIAPAAVGNAHSQPSTPGNGSRKLSRPANWGRGLANALHAAVRCAAASVRGNFAGIRRNHDDKR